MARATWAQRLLVLGCVGLLALVLGLGPLSALAASTVPTMPDAPVVLDRGPDPTAPRAHVRTLPAGLTAAQLDNPWTDLRAAAVRVLGADTAGAVLARIERGDPALYLDVASAEGTAYPSTFAWVQRALDQAPGQARTADAARLAAQLIAVAAPRSTVDHALSRYPDAAPLARALLARSGTLGGCDADLNRLLLLASDDKPRDDVVAAQAAVTEQTCPGDPTALWLLGQFQLQRAALAGLADFSESERTTLVAERFARSSASADRLVAQFPGSPDAWLGFGDASLRAGTELAGDQPFGSRFDLERAQAAYARAGRLEPSVAARVGEARALTALGRPTEALALTADGLDLTSLGAGLELKVDAQEAARDFPGAAATATKLAALGAAAYPRTGPLHPREAPLSLGAGSAVPLVVALQPGPTNGSSGGADVADLGFIPETRQIDAVTEPAARCPEFARLRGAILAGDPRTAAAVDPTSPAGSAGSAAMTTTQTPTGRYCDLRELRAIASLEAGLPLPQDGPDASRAEDERQDLWRWAGDLDRAATAAMAWDATTGRTQPLPALRLGEIRFRQGRCTDAAALFGTADRRGQEGYAITPAQGRARLDRAAALLACGRDDEALDLLRSLDRDASIAQAQFSQGTPQTRDDDVAHRYALLSYYARLQLGDAERLAGANDAAGEDYAAAAERAAPIIAKQQVGQFNDDDVVVVPGVVENNWAVAELQRNRPGPATEHARNAVAADPRNPVFLLTLATAQRQDGQPDMAADTAGQVVALEPTAFPMWNDRAVELAETGHPTQARQALRRAVGARPDYALGWFNLGVLESRRGPVAALVSEGAFARAFAADPSLTDAPRTLTYDDHSYRTGLDLSRPVPWTWSFAGVERRPPVARWGSSGSSSPCWSRCAGSADRPAAW